MGKSDNSYADKPGSGPSGETCGTCKRHATVYLGGPPRIQCGVLIIRNKPFSPTDDIDLNSKACSYWEKL